MPPCHPERSDRRERSRRIPCGASMSASRLWQEFAAMARAARSRNLRPGETSAAGRPRRPKPARSVPQPKNLATWLRCQFPAGATSAVSEPPAKKMRAMDGLMPLGWHFDLGFPLRVSVEDVLKAAFRPADSSIARKNFAGSPVFPLQPRYVDRDAFSWRRTGFFDYAPFGRSAQDDRGAACSMRAAARAGSPTSQTRSPGNRRVLRLGFMRTSASCSCATTRLL